MHKHKVGPRPLWAVPRRLRIKAWKLLREGPESGSLSLGPLYDEGSQCFYSAVVGGFFIFILLSIYLSSQFPRRGNAVKASRANRMSNNVPSLFSVFLYTCNILCVHIIHIRRQSLIYQILNFWRGNDWNWNIHIYKIMYKCFNVLDGKMLRSI